ncbi:MAG: hypothetical protein HY300_20225 [Verrucomicrobia bacterium]|nr:hypothetical protein [Verrucomicrobiota bacterium]
MKTQNLNVVAIGDLYMPCRVMKEALTLLKPSRVTAIEWKARDVAELQAWLLQVEQNGPAARELVQWERTVQPDQNRVQLYDELRERQQVLQTNLIELVNQSALKAMWRAPGIWPMSPHSCSKPAAGRDRACS